jgi:uncharacterized protein (TIGR03437 family)
MHNGSLQDLEEVVEFYDRGGDFDSPNKDRNFVKPLKLSAQEKSDLVAFLQQLTDPRVEAEAAPLFDRPMLYSESARVPRILGQGTAGSGGVIPQIHAIEPPVAGNPRFTVGLSGALRAARAVLVIDAADPGTGPAIPETASFARRTVTVADAADGHGYASVSLQIPDDPALPGTTLFGRWFVEDPGAVNGVAVTPAFRMTVFAPASPPPPARIFSSVSAASLALGLVAPESLVSGFGENLAATMENPTTVPLPTTLGGVSVSIKDSAGNERLAPLFYVSPTQLNYQIPPGTAGGEATVTVLRGNDAVASGNAQVATVAPALFAANSDGRDTAAALALHVSADNSRTQQPVARLDVAQGRFVSAPIDLGAQSDRVFLILFGTGIRFHASAEVSAQIGGEAAQVTYAGPQPEFVGVDQVNVLLPRSLAARGDVDVVVTVDGQRTNTVRVNIQ